MSILCKRIMITLKRILIVLLVAASFEVCVAGTEKVKAAEVQLQKATRLERPALAARLVSKAAKAEREGVALGIVKYIAKDYPELLGAVIGAVVSEVPSSAAKIVSTAVQVSPSSLFEVAKAAAAASPKKAQDIALALAALKPGELLKICLAVSLGAPSEAAHGVGVLSKQFPERFNVVAEGYLTGAPEKGDDILRALVVALPGLESTPVGQEVRRSRLAGANTQTVTKRKVSVVNTSLKTISIISTAIANSIKTATSNSGSSGVSLSIVEAIKAVVSGDIAVNTTTGAVTISEGSDLAKSLAKLDNTTAQLITSAVDTTIQNEVTNTESALNKALDETKTQPEQILNTESVTVIIDENTVRAYSN